METRLCLICVLINCFVIQYSETKPFSLNEAIAAEAQQKHKSEGSSVPVFEDTSGERFSLYKVLTSSTKKENLKETDSILSRRKKITSPLKYKKTFQIKSPLKPKKLKYSPRARFTRKNQSVKREINDNDIFNQKYIPLLRSVSMLFDNILGPDASDDYEEINQYKQKRTRYYSGERDELECTCALASELPSNNGMARKKADPLATSPATEITTTTEVSSKIEVATATTDNTTLSDISSFGHHTDIPVLLPRNSFGGWRENNGFSARSSTTHNGSFERYISRDNGNSEYISGIAEDRPYAESDERITDSDSRDGTGSGGSGERLREHRNNTRETDEVVGHEINESKSETIKEPRRETLDFQRQDQLEMDRDETKSSEYVSEPIRRLRGATPKTKIETIADLPTSVSEKSIPDVTLDSASIKRIANRGSTLATENKEVHQRHEAMSLIKEPNTSHNSKSSTPVVVIIDGYSVTRNRNGEKKLARKAIHINPK